MMTTIGKKKKKKAAAVEQQSRRSSGSSSSVHGNSDKESIASTDAGSDSTVSSGPGIGAGDVIWLFQGL